jgi:hypothetical protein
MFRECGTCKSILELTYYRKVNQTCNRCLENDKERYANNRDVLAPQRRDYELNIVEKEQERQILCVRKCIRCRTILNLTFYQNEHLTCNICLEKEPINICKL